MRRIDDLGIEYMPCLAFSKLGETPTHSLHIMLDHNRGNSGGASLVCWCADMWHIGRVFARSDVKHQFELVDPRDNTPGQGRTGDLQRVRLMS